MFSQPPPRATTIFAWFMAAGFAIALSACRSTAPQQTATAAHAEALSSLASLRSSATVVRARAQTTLDHAGTRVAQADAAGAFLASNLISLGTEAAYIEDSLRALQLLGPASANTPSPGQTAGAFPGQPPPATPPANAIVTPPAISPAPSPTRSGPRLESLTMASAVDADDCAIDVNPRFTPASSAIYVVARAYNIPAGASISSTWRRSGAEVVSFSFYREHEINDSCVWFYIDQTDTPFTVGAWSVELRVDGQPLASPVAFQILAN